MERSTAIVTGGAGGIGLGIAEALLVRNFNIIVFDIDRQRMKDVNNERIICMEVDVTNESSVVSAVNNVVNEFGKIDVLVNNAGVILSEPLINIMNSEQPRHSYDMFTQNLKTNLNSVFLVGSIVAEKMVLKRNKGIIVNISSICALGNPGQSAYSAAKAGVDALTKVWSRELGSFGIRVASVAPGFINIESTKLALSEKKLKDLESKIPLRRLGGIHNVAQVVLQVLDNDYINGNIIAVDGGLTL